MNRYIAEALGTFALVFFGSGAIIVNASGGSVTSVGVALVFGLIVLAMIYAIGDISGAHINPAVTLGFWSAGRFPAGDVPQYVGAQMAGAVIASFVLKFLFPQHSGLGATLPSGSTMQAFIIEAILTFFLMFVVLNVSIGSKEKGFTAGIAVGSVVALEALFAGPVTGASMNPARSLAPALVSGNLHAIFVYIAGPIVGAFLGVLVFRLIKE